jgi:hypothetical protein
MESLRRFADGSCMRSRSRFGPVRECARSHEYKEPHGQRTQCEAIECSRVRGAFFIKWLASQSSRQLDRGSCRHVEVPVIGSYALKHISDRASNQGGLSRSEFLLSLPRCSRSINLLSSVGTMPVPAGSLQDELVSQGWVCTARGAAYVHPHIDRLPFNPSPQWSNALQ